MDKQEKIEYLAELIGCCHKNLTIWQLDRNANLVTPDDEVSRMFYYTFHASHCPEHLLSYLQKEESRRVDNVVPRPVMLTDMFELAWVAAFSCGGGGMDGIYLLGPVHISEHSRLLLLDGLVSSKFSSSLKTNVLELFDQIATVPFSALFHYTGMLHYALNGEALRSFVPEAIASPKLQKLQEGHSIQYASSFIDWQTEEQLAKNIEDGNLKYKDSYQVAQRIGSPNAKKNSSLRQNKNILISFVTTCYRAAIKGGLSPAIAYSVRDGYFVSIEAAENRAQLVEICHSMYDDFIQRVHQFKNQKKYSAPIQSCLDYISLHIREKLPLCDLSSLVGYTDYYLSRKFKAETGMSVSDYIKQEKIKEAKKLLASTSLTVQEISEQLNFCSRSHFPDIFQKQAGITPTQYREENMRL